MLQTFGLNKNLPTSGELQPHVAQRSYFTGISTNFLLGKRTLNINLSTQVSQKTTPELLEHTWKTFLFLTVLYCTPTSSLTKTSCKSAAYSKCWNATSAPEITPLAVNITFCLEALTAQTLPSCAACQVALMGLGAIAGHGALQLDSSTACFSVLSGCLGEFLSNKFKNAKPV